MNNNMNITKSIPIIINNNNLFLQRMRRVNFFLSWTGLISNLILMIILFVLHRRHCTTYFLLLLMVICDCIYCGVYVSIALTVEQYINIINREIICPLSFFLQPFTFTGSALLLFICLLHVLTKFERKYDTILGQISGRFSAVLIFAFVIIRSLLGSTSIQLMSDPFIPGIRHCVIDMNTTLLVATIQNLNHIFAEVTDMLVYAGWIILILLYFLSFIRWRKMTITTNKNGWDMQDIEHSIIARKQLTFSPILIVNDRRQSTPMMTIDSSDGVNILNETTMMTNEKRHRYLSRIILSLGFLSILFYPPVITIKYSTLYFLHRKIPLFTYSQSMLLQSIEQTTLLLCLSLRIIPYLIFDKRIRLLIRRAVGIECPILKMTIMRRQQQHQSTHKYAWHCQCHRRQKPMELSSNNDEEYKHYETKV